jgi:hypothetical protein
MCLRPALLASAIGLCLATVQRAQADVVYTVFNPSRNFTLFVYDSPTFITTNTTVDAAQLAFINPLNNITSVDFIPSSPTGTSELDVFETNPPPEQSRYYPLGTFTQFGVTPGDSNSFGGSNSMLRVAAPEPCTFGLLGVGLIGLLGLRRWKARLSGPWSG